MRWKLYITVLLVLSSGVLYWACTGEMGGPIEKVYVSRVVDGDTIELGSGLKVRLMGINTPESSMLLHEGAKVFLEGLVLEREVVLESFGGDKYGRVLGYISVGGVSINEEILRQGFGSLYYYDKDAYYDDMVEAEELARSSELGIWSQSDNYGCVELVEFDWDEPEKIVLNNDCGEVIDVVIKDDATHIYRERLEEGLWEKGFSHIWNTDGDSLYIWDDSGLVLFYRYS
jgi:endonuclease YncB( thermonuclease family)